MKDFLIQYKIKQIQNTNIYSINTINGNYNPVQNQKYFLNKTDKNKYKLIITNENIEGINNLVLFFKLPEIKGKGIIYYNYNFAFSLIKSLSIYINKSHIISLNSFQILREFILNEKNKNIYNMLLGNDNNWLKQHEGFGSDYIIYPERDITIPIKTIFDQDSPMSILRIPKGSVIKIEVEFNPIQSVINYNYDFKINSLSNIQDIYSPMIIMSEYNTIGEVIKPRFIEQYEEIKDNVKKEQYSTPHFKNISNLSFYIKSSIFTSEKSFIFYPDYLMDEKEIIKKYEEILLNEMIKVSKDTNFINDFPANSKFEEVINNQIVFNQINKCFIEILNIPKDYKIFYHKNVLTFSRRNNDKIYNISEKFKFITGIYFPSLNKIEFTNVVSSITISDVSIPIELWNHEFNTAFGDLRSNKEKEIKDIYVNNPQIIGLDFMSKDSGISNITIETGCSMILFDYNTLNNFLFVNNSQTIIPIPKAFPAIYSINFNNHDILFIEPSKLIAKPKENFNLCNLLPLFSSFNENDIRVLIPFEFVIGINYVKKINLVNKDLVVIEL